MFWKTWRTYRKRARDNGLLALGLAENLASILAERLNGILDSPPCYKVTIVKGVCKNESFITFRIDRNNIPSRSPLQAGFVLLAKTDTIDYILELTEHDKDKLENTEYLKLLAVLTELFGRYEEVRYNCSYYGQEKDSEHQKTNFHC